MPVSYIVFRFVVAKFIVEKVEAAAAAASGTGAAPQQMAQAA
jgi:hypothetical protein